MPSKLQTVTRSIDRRTQVGFERLPETFKWCKASMTAYVGLKLLEMFVWKISFKIFGKSWFAAIFVEYEEFASICTTCGTRQQCLPVNCSSQRHLQWCRRRHMLRETKRERPRKSTFSWAKWVPLPHFCNKMKGNVFFLKRNKHAKSKDRWKTNNQYSRSLAKVEKQKNKTQNPEGHVSTRVSSESFVFLVLLVLSFFGSFLALFW